MISAAVQQAIGAGVNNNEIAFNYAIQRPGVRQVLDDPAALRAAVLAWLKIQGRRPGELNWVLTQMTRTARRSDALGRGRDVTLNYHKDNRGDGMSTVAPSRETQGPKFWVRSH